MIRGSIGSNHESDSEQAKKSDREDGGKEKPG